MPKKRKQSKINKEKQLKKKEKENQENKNLIDNVWDVEFWKEAEH